MYEIRKSYTFSASHQLTHLPKDHQCARLHGHNYTVEIVCTSALLDGDGFVIDFGELKPIKDWLNDTFDHRHLNDVMDVWPTSENFARYIYEEWRPTFPMIHAVRVSETGTSWAEYRENN